MLLLFETPYQFVEFILEHVRFALRTRGYSKHYNISWDIFANYVLPYGILDEKRDLSWRWRPRLQQLLLTDAARGSGGPGPLVSWSDNITATMHTITKTLPHAYLDHAVGVEVLANATNPNPSFMSRPGSTVKWRSETAPAMLSPEQVVQYGGASCTGTAVILVAAARAVGIPARIAGCSQSVVVGDDHHWVEFYDPTAAGPFGDYWHTKEGVSAGNEGGPWDGASGPMNGCLRGVIAHNNMNTIWAASWKSTTYLPLQWSTGASQQEWAFLGGENRCGSYCTAWGCGTNQTAKYTQAQCNPV